METKFMIGQSVEYLSDVVGRPGARGVYKIVAALPREQGEQQYRIKSVHEPHERVVRESQLTRGH